MRDRLNCRYELIFLLQARRHGSWIRASHAEPVRVLLPDEPPRLTPAAARALLLGPSKGFGDGLHGRPELLTEQMRLGIAEKAGRVLDGEFWLIAQSGRKDVPGPE